MFGKYQAVFRSRWRALIWACGVLATAYCSIPAPDDEAGDPGMEAAEAALVAMVGQGRGEAERPHEHVNPWALDPDQQH